MRLAFIAELEKLAGEDSSIVLLTADLGYSVFENFIRKFPHRYYNVGISEQNMAGLAAGLALEGFRPIIYSIIPFTTMRNYEQLRNDICYQNLPVIVVGVGSGFSYGPYGRTHHALEDISIMRTLPGMTVFSPSDPIETQLVTREAYRLKSPSYIRLGKAGEPNLHKKPFKFTLGKIYNIRKGDNVAVFVTGNIASEVLLASDTLSKRGFRISVYTIPTIKPIDRNSVRKEILRHKTIITVEEHSIIGGLGSTIAEIIAEESMNVLFKRIAVQDPITHFVGNQEYMRKKNGINATSIAKKIFSIIQK